MHPRQIRKVFSFQAQALVTVEDCSPYSYLLQTAIYRPLASLATRWSHCWELCWEPESLVAVTSQAELWEPMRSPTSQLFHPSFLYWMSALQWRDLARYAALVPQFPSLGPKTWPLAEVTLSGSLPAICLLIHPATAPMGWDSAGNKSTAQEPWLLQDFGSPSRQSFPPAYFAPWRYWWLPGPNTSLSYLLSPPEYLFQSQPSQPSLLPCLPLPTSWCC